MNEKEEAIGGRLVRTVAGVRVREAADDRSSLYIKIFLLLSLSGEFLADGKLWAYTKSMLF